MDISDQINIWEAGAMGGPGPQNRFEWQCRCLALMTDSSIEEVREEMTCMFKKQVAPFLEMINSLSVKQPGEIGRPIISEIPSKQILSPVFVRVIDDVASLPPLGSAVHWKENKVDLFVRIQKQFDYAANQLATRFEHMLRDQSFDNALQQLYTELLAEAEPSQSK